MGHSLLIRPSALLLVGRSPFSPDGGLPLAAPARGGQAVECLVQRVVKGLK